MVFRILFLLLSLTVYTFVYPQGKLVPTAKENAATVYSKFNINNISTLIYNNGNADIEGADSGFEYPKGTNKTAVYKSGFVFGGKIDGELRVGGSTFGYGIQPGKILNNGLAEDPNLENVRVFRVRRDYKSADLGMEAEDEGKSIQQIYDQYDKDWNEWRVNDGAPFEDVDGNGFYGSSIDIPGIPGADQTLWFVANDLDSMVTKSFYGSPTIGIELQVSIWGYRMEEPVGNTVFKKYLLINKSDKEIKEMYIGIWADPDLGDAGDDLVGCDTLLNLGYVYNGDDHDWAYGQNVPSLGFLLLQGPIIDGASTSYGTFKGKRIKGKRNLRMTAFSNIPKTFHPPEGSYEGTIEMYNLFQGLQVWGYPYPIPDYLGGGYTKFPFSGDPVSRTGYIGGTHITGSMADLPGDHYMMISSGPFNMMPGDTQEVIFAQVIAGGSDDIDRLGAIILLKHYSQSIRSIFSGECICLPTVKTPIVNYAELDNKIVLHWGEKESAENVEFAGNSIFAFQGYNIYQLSRAYSKLEEGRKIATFDVVDGIGNIYDYVFDLENKKYNYALKQSGKDSGIQRYISIDYDYIHNRPMSNGSTYYFAITSYLISDNLSISPNNYESEPYIITVTPHSFNPGVVTKDFGEELSSSHIAGNSDAEIKAVVIDPYKLNGHEYEITFQNNNGLSWSLVDITDNKEIFSNQANFLGDNDYLIADGLMFVVKEGTTDKLTTEDIYKITAPLVEYNNTKAKEDVEKINVFPNPYYGASEQQIDKYDRYVTFTHLPNKATIRIFNLAGQLVRKLEKDNSDQFVRWDMLNESRFIVPSGLYIVHIEMPEVGKTKVLKLAVLYEQLVPDYY
ncbi:MAG: T9SS type A sorting domain-containing protein [Bacteroidota bacterium]